MKTLEDSVALAAEMVNIGENAGRRTMALITDMDTPLGEAIGNSLEVKEAVATLKGRGPKDLTEVCLHLAANMMVLAGLGTTDECMAKAQNAIADGSALQKLIDMVEAQGGDGNVIRDTDLFEKAKFSYEVIAKEDGVIQAMDTEKCGIASVMLGAGRETKDSPVDLSAGILLYKKTGDTVKKGDTLAVLYAAKEELFAAAEAKYRQAVTIGTEPVDRKPLIFAKVSKDGVERFV